MNSLQKEFLAESIYRFQSSFVRLFHCLEQLNDDQIWWKPDKRMNSTGILIKHLCGNLRQWTIIQMNNSADERNRPEEFKDDLRISKKNLIEMLNRIKEDFISAVNNFKPERLNEPKVIQGYDVTVMTAIYRSLTHLEGHVGQIILLSRLQLGESYNIYSDSKSGKLKAP